MKKNLIIDGHCDSLGDFVNGKRTLSAFSDLGHWDIERAEKANIGLQFFAAYIESEYKPVLANWRGFQLLEAGLRFIESNKEKIFLVQKKNDLQILGKGGKIGLLLSVEGGEILGESLFMLEIIYRLGVRSLCLTWNERNAIGDGVGETDSASRLSGFGVKVVRRMNELGMVVDVSHLNEPGFWHVLDISDQPVIASHSCARKLCSHPRNLNDEQLRALARNKGLVGVNFCPEFLNESGKADINDVVRHICHIAETAGVETVGFGSDFDGISSVPQGLEDVTKFPHLIDKLQKAGFSSKEIDKICHENFVRVLSAVLK